MLTSKELAADINVSEMTVKRWRGKLLLKASSRQGDAMTSPDLFDSSEVLVAHVLRELENMGGEAGMTRPIVSALRALRTDATLAAFDNSGRPMGTILDVEGQVIPRHIRGADVLPLTARDLAAGAKRWLWLEFGSGRAYAYVFTDYDRMREVIDNGSGITIALHPFYAA